MIRRGRSVDPPVAFALAVTVVAGIMAAGANGSVRASSPVTLVTATAHIDAFAQDQGEIAWAQDYTGICGSVFVETLATRKQHQLITENGATCGLGNGVIQEIAVAGGRAVWAAFYGSNETDDVSLLGGSLVGKSAGKDDIDLDDVSTIGGAASNGPGLGPVNLRGDGTTFVWADPPQIDPIAGTSPASVMRSVNGHVSHVPGLTSYAAGLLSLSGDMLALAPTKGAASVDLRSVTTGKLGRTITLAGAATALALSTGVLAVATGSTIVRFDPATGKKLGSTKAGGAVEGIAASGATVVFATGKTIRMISASGRLSTLTTASAPPVGLSIEGTRVAWAEGKRIRALTVPG